MIQYYKSAFGLGLLLRFNGSAVYRSTVPGFISAILVVIFNLYEIEMETELLHPYAIGVLVASLTFLLVFRVQQGYARYWEAASCVHHFMSKWMDAVIHTAAFHMQCTHYDKIKPPSFFDYPELNQMYLTRSRERYTTIDESTEGPHDEHERLHDRARNKSIEDIRQTMGYLKSKSRIPVPSRGLPGIAPSDRYSSRFNSSGLSSNATTSEFGDPIPLEGPGRFDGNWGNLFNDGKATFFNPRSPTDHDQSGFASYQGGHTPPLFLQELTHLTSLLTGVALSTLRNDVEGAESPLDIYEPGSTWPAVDPDHAVDSGSPNGKGGLEFTWKQRILNFLGVGRSPTERTQHNAARPLPVLGGVSEGEIRFLQMARGPFAKTQLCWYWLSEFITREHLAGSLGKVGPPIISRIIQFLGDGMIYYNHARKIMFIPFPFPHAQLSVFYVFASIPAVAVLMNQYAVEMWAGAVLSFLTVTCLSGIHEVARELENPFRNIPNDIPVVTLQAQFNECLITMYAGYHPDHYWGEAADDFLKHRRRAKQSSDELNVDNNNNNADTNDEKEAKRPPQKKDEQQCVPNAEQCNFWRENKPTEQTADPSSVQLLLEQMEQQKNDFKQQLEGLEQKQREESERQKTEIEQLRAQLLLVNGGSENGKPPAVRKLGDSHTGTY